MKRVCFVMGLITWTLICVAECVAGGYELDKVFVRGVYYGNQFERHAAAAGKNVPAFVDQFFRDLRETYHCNLFWINTGGIPDQLQTLDIAAKHDLKILCSARWDYGNFTTPMETEAKMEAVAKRVTDAFKNHKAFAGYVICEEDDVATVAQMDYVRQLFERFDPSHPGINVASNGVVQYAYRTGFPFLCPEAYVWGGPGAVYCPKTPESSRQYYTQMIDGLGDLSRKTGKIAWMMTQSYAAGTGQQWIDDKSNLIIEAGSAWAPQRMPTPAEIRFQIWDAVRAGCRGVVFFLPLPNVPPCPPDKKNLTKAEKQWVASMAKSAAALKGQTDISVLKKRTDTGAPQALLKLDGSATPQSRALGEAFAAIEKLESLMVSWKRAAFPAVFAEHPAAVNTFELPSRPGRRFAVVVNHDIATKQVLHLLFAPNVTRVTDLRSGGNVALRPMPTDPDELQSAEMPLEAGDGTILELAFKEDRPGILLFDEDFTHFGSPLVLENTERINFPFVSGIGDYWAVRKARAPLTDGAARATGVVLGKQEGPAPCVRLTKLQETAINLGPLGGSLTLAAQGLCDVFLAVEGTFPKAESLVIETVNKDGKEAWLRSDGHFHPVRIPAKDAAGKEIVEIRFLLADDALLTGVRCWRIGKNK